MKGTIQNLTINGYECLLYLPPEYETSGAYYPVVYINGEDEISEIMESVEPHFGLECEVFLMLSVQSANWNDEYSPWPVPGLTKKDKPFGGGASGYLCFLAGIVKPFIDLHYHTKQEPESTALIGYSLGGLVSLYALYTCRTFGKIGSLSGSLWFEGWTEFMESNMTKDTGAKVYLSLGEREEHTRNQRMAKVGDCTRKAAEILKQQLKSESNLTLVWNNGGHFTEIPQRYQKAVMWLMWSNKRDHE
ncbi:MAG: esterase [Clostridiales bacterium]|nr:esterase [Clostridiales bacterium]